MATMTHRSREDAPAPAQQPSTKADKDKAAAAHARSSSSQAPRKVRFNVGSRYQVLDVIGEGAYGVV
jgi:mitogen-activated protein kinase 1/3